MKQDRKEYMRQYKVKYREINKELIKVKNAEYYQATKEKRKERDAQYYIDNKEKIKERKKNYHKRRLINDPTYKLSVNIRKLINHSLTSRGTKKQSKTVDILGCSFDEFRLYLEAKFEPWMHWGNYGLYNGTEQYGWDLDHIIPSSTAITDDDIIRLNHYTNLQPLCSRINRDIKRANYF